MLKATRRIGVPAAQALRSYWGTAALGAATAAAALAAVLPVASLVRGSAAGFAPRVGLAMLRALEPVRAWIEPESPAATQNEAVTVLFQLLVGTAFATLAVASLTLLGLFVARASQRAPEIAVRRAVGASKLGLLASTLVEAGALAAVAVLIGTGVGVIGARWAVSSWPGITVPGSAGTTLATVAAAVLAICLGAIIPAALAPGRRIAETPAHPLSLAVPALQLGASLLALTVGAVLTREAAVRMTPELTAAAPGQVFEVTPRDLMPAERARRYGALLERLARRPELDTVSLTSPGALLGLGTVSVVTTVCGLCRGGGIMAPWHFESAVHQFVSADSFQALGVHVLAGRGITSADRWDAPRVAVVSRGLAIRHFQNGMAIGRMIRIGNDTEWHTVVGVVDDPPAAGLGAALQPPFAVYLSILQHPVSSVELLARPRRGTADQSIGPVLERILDPRPGDLMQLSESQLLAAQTAPLRWFGRWFVVEGWAMLSIAVTGAFVLMRLWVLSLLTELGLRRAVGASRRRLLALVFCRAAAVGVGGLGVGLWLGPSVWDVLGSVLGELPKWDPAVAARFAVVLLGTTIAGATLPAWQATQVAPAVLLQAAE
jgi:putative ABC transport system permease protein